MTTATETRSLVIEKSLAQPPEKVWRALTESNLIAQWLMKNDFAPAKGHKFQFRADPVPGWNGLIDCEVQVLEPMKELKYTWVTMGHEMVVHWTLTPTAEGTHLRMEQSGFGPGMEQAYKGASYGWQKFIGQLEKVVGEAQ